MSSTNQEKMPDSTDQVLRSDYLNAIIHAIEENRAAYNMPCDWQDSLIVEIRKELSCETTNLHFDHIREVLASATSATEIAKLKRLIRDQFLYKEALYYALERNNNARDDFKKKASSECIEWREFMREHASGF